MNRDAAAVKQYVTANDHLQYTWLAEGTVQVNVTHSNLRQFVQVSISISIKSNVLNFRKKNKMESEPKLFFFSIFYYMVYYKVISIINTFCLPLSFICNIIYFMNKELFIISFVYPITSFFILHEFSLTKIYVFFINCH